MNDFFDKVLIKNKIITIDIQSLLTVIITIIFTYLIIRYLYVFKRRILKKNIKWSFQVNIFEKTIIFLIIFTALVIVLKAIGIAISDFMKFEIIKGKTFSLTPYDILIIIIIFILTRGFNSALKKLYVMQFGKGDDKKLLYSNMNILKLVRYFVWIIAIIITLQTIGINLTLLLASSAALLVGVGIGMQQIFSDMISGLFLLFEKNLKINDIVEIDNVIGKVKDIGIRTSRIIDINNIELIVPNSKLVSNKVINWSYNDPKTRFQLPIGVAYGSDVSLLKNVLLEVAENHNLILKKPSPVIIFKDFGESSLNFELNFWTYRTFDHYIIKSDLRFAIEKKFRENNIEIPFPQRDIHVKKN